MYGGHWSMAWPRLLLWAHYNVDHEQDSVPEWKRSGHDAHCQMCWPSPSSSHSHVLCMRMDGLEGGGQTYLGTTEWRFLSYTSVCMACTLIHKHKWEICHVCMSSAGSSWMLAALTCLWEWVTPSGSVSVWTSYKFQVRYTMSWPTGCRQTGLLHSPTRIP